ncbi:tRNA 2-thiouridine(34) synthase MnmA [candidate division CPR3 bacterium GWF2_35_18]|uniref:tRNA-specific 2-thiouridylase MnmA n=1 Tax=candidate division CPR3 bacterium GW2011_GWF2_35_18 TaxID=1618350 RepID=A0A0G0E490_UNCC3|nr:MAG: tRNA (5-methylaminomethyl-2-thiouridylate)-methyltransferase [candidate division CPR3 bacterium GW2011_GWF2_35_18]KKP86717.1 MAG: tRNA (5-methylaminomethyl-2-thiouridylate)-methyltransferase [candidate division CPR3 bacterium GW2011_GWE2_35_7]OGB63370.1 MAG: tRNA 2-thiouridine(34) synthase MnmA [candidate division CPR3 bacterium GWF2_35_18]OGB64885.1 MAG: tRNA 2-thiouridine(34) synthase MnmA [candidate division CPR3 bacterium RIFOXYA2_FULL_35_13]OGB77056.1 MAG: tRNA 2-thiouridine(34) sy
MKIACLVSGGVDSSTSLYLLQQQGFKPEAFYIKIWMEDDFFDCPWKEDLEYVKKVTKKLKVKLNVVSMQKEYWDKIIKYTLNEVRIGRTPNPDVFCNTFIKFGLFYEKYGKDFDKVATGHYARIINDDKAYLAKAKDPSKDQAYFLSQMTKRQLSRCMFPVGDLLKTEVRKIAKEANLATHSRPDSQGLCFLGKVNFKQFLEKYVGIKNGDIIDLDSKQVIGNHQGHWFFTLGQREGLKIGGAGLPYYVADKDALKNIVYVVKGQDHKALWKNKLGISNLNILVSDSLDETKIYDVQLRYHSSIIKATIKKQKNNLKLILQKPYFAVAPGQIGVLYDKDLIVASGIIK